MMMTKMATIRMLATLLFVLPIAISAGCGLGAAQQAGDEQLLKNQVDKTLSGDQQGKQDAVRRLLNALVEGVGDESGLAIYAPGIDLRAKIDDVGKGPGGELIGWEFKGQPTDNRVPVVLYFAEKRNTRVNREQSPHVERVFEVARNGDRFSIAPK
jgi:hypothetical protein